MKILFRTAIAAVLMLGSLPVQAQQAADPEYEPAIASVTSEGEAPVVVIDAAHRNFHRIDGRFGPFARLAEHGGFAVEGSAAPFSADTLDMDILVMANAALAPSEEEVDALLTWLHSGGSLLLIADHAPFGGYAAELAARFGVDMGDGFVVVGRSSNVRGIIDFRRRNLGEHPITEREDGNRAVGLVRTFLGQSLSVPEGASVLLALPSSAVELPSRGGIEQYRRGHTNGTDVSDRAQAIAFAYGEGRVVISGEAAMFTSQVSRQNGNAVRVGVSQADNEAYVLNVLDWLAGRI